MQHEEFIGEVQHRAELASHAEALRITRATLTTLGERLQAGEASDLAAPLPMEIDRFLHQAESGQIFDYTEFLQRVSERARADEADAAFYAQVVMDVVEETAPGGEFDDVRAQLPPEYDDLFELVGADYYEN